MDAAVVAVEREGPPDQLRGGRVHRGEVAEVELEGEDVDARGGVIGCGAPGPQPGRGGGPAEVGAQLGGGLGGLAGVAGGGDEDEVRGQGAGGEELVDEALADAEPDAAVGPWSEYLCLLNGLGLGGTCLRPSPGRRRCPWEGRLPTVPRPLGRPCLNNCS